ncbi:MAG: nuclear transport factor 2 family protein [Thermoleophilia bacterium]|nr:nuclear transport factor 2 family protein [Thermoleophilia bacterium]
MSEIIRQQVIDANQEFYEAFEALDLVRMEACWSDRPGTTCIHPGGSVLVGWPIIRASWEAIMYGGEEILVDVEIVDVVIEDPVAWITCLERMSTMRQGGHAGPSVVATNVFVLDATGWRMVLHHASPVQ